MFDVDQEFTPNTKGNYTIVFAAKDGMAAIADNNGGVSRMSGDILGFFDKRRS